MKAFFLLAVVSASIAGCATPAPEPVQAASMQAVPVAKLPTGTLIARNPTDKGSAPLTEANKQALENERLMNSWKR